MVTIPIALGDRSYDVLVGEIDVEAAADRLAAVVGRASGVAALVDGSILGPDSRAGRLLQILAQRLPGIPIRQRALPAGEACKTIAHLGDTCEWLAKNGFDRKAVILGIGGGATTDHAGFAAAIYLRGVDFVLCPTTLLAMVDASVGGKTAVDLPAGKNLVGAFHQPRLVVADVNFLQTLPVREQAAGMAEVVKAGLIADAPLFEELERGAAKLDAMPRDRVTTLIAAAVRIKAEVVTEDERENDRRAILNFGHTVGHALETESSYGLLHGEAVALGMMAALKLGVARKVTAPDLVSRVGDLLTRLDLPADVVGRLNANVLQGIEVDKKRRADHVRFVFVPRPGEAVLQDVSLADLRTQLTALI